jgi:ribosomal protein L24
VGFYYRYKRGDQVFIVSGRYAGVTGVVESAIFQRTVDYPEEYAPGYHILLNDGRVVTVRWDQVQPQPLVFRWLR